MKLCRVFCHSNLQLNLVYIYLYLVTMAHPGIACVSDLHTLLCELTQHLGQQPLVIFQDLCVHQDGGNLVSQCQDVVILGKMVSNICTTLCLTRLHFRCSVNFSGGCSRLTERMATSTLLCKVLGVGLALALILEAASA